ncbi:MAG TPA: sigma-70 family RNA polymerase sigma factor [Gemmataceae bacterium]|jgi:RNA polymerase sigma factor (sigma-70 family)
MTTNPLRTALNHLRQALRPSGEDALSDGQLLTRFVATRDEAAFAALVRRHGPMVLGVCRRVLRHAQDAEDACQASFLVLARKAASVAHRQAVASWLYRVSYRIALEARAINERRKAREKQVEDMPHPQVLPAEVQDWRPWLDHELNRLPEKYRTAIILCDLEGRSRREAARQLEVPEGTLSSRLATARRLLAKRLSRYGLALSGGTLAVVMSEGAASAVPAPLASDIVLAASGQGVVSASVGFLMKGALKVMFLTKLKWAVGAVMVVMALGATGLAYRASGQPTPAPAAQSAPEPAAKRDGNRTPTELEALRQEVELLKRKMEVVQEKLQAQEAELRALRAATVKSAPPAFEGLREMEEMELWERVATDLARDAGNQQQWPPLLLDEAFKDAREDFGRHLKQAISTIQLYHCPDASTLNVLQADLKRMDKSLDNGVDYFAPDRFTEAKRYLRRLDGVIFALRKFDGKQSKQGAMDALESAMKKLREKRYESRR